MLLLVTFLLAALAGKVEPLHVGPPSAGAIGSTECTNGHLLAIARIQAERAIDYGDIDWVPSEGAPCAGAKEVVPLKDRYNNLEEFDAEIADLSGGWDRMVANRAFSTSAGRMSTWDDEKVALLQKHINEQQLQNAPATKTFHKAVAWRKKYPCFDPRMLMPPEDENSFLAWENLGLTEPCTFTVEEFQLPEGARYRPVTVTWTPDLGVVPPDVAAQVADDLNPPIRTQKTTDVVRPSENPASENPDSEVLTKSGSAPIWEVLWWKISILVFCLFLLLFLSWRMYLHFARSKT